jgi:hypothetical protein
MSGINPSGQAKRLRDIGEDQIPACPVCLTGFHRDKPLLLRCGHTLCESCVRNVLTTYDPTKRGSCLLCHDPLGFDRLVEASVNEEVLGIVRSFVDQLGLRPIARARVNGYGGLPERLTCPADAVSRLQRLLQDHFLLDLEKLTKSMNRCGAAIVGDAVVCACIADKIDTVAARRWQIEVDLDIMVPSSWWKSRHTLTPIDEFLVKEGYARYRDNEEVLPSFAREIRLYERVVQLPATSNKKVVRVTELSENYKPFEGLPRLRDEQITRYKCDSSVLNVVREFDLSARLFIYSAGTCASLITSGPVLAITMQSKFTPQDAFMWLATIGRVYKYVERGFLVGNALDEAVLLFSTALFNHYTKGGEKGASIVRKIMDRVRDNASRALEGLDWWVTGVNVGATSVMVSTYDAYESRHRSWTFSKSQLESAIANLAEEKEEAMALAIKINGELEAKYASEAEEWWKLNHSRQDSDENTNDDDEEDSGRIDIVVDELPAESAVDDFQHPTRRDLLDVYVTDGRETTFIAQKGGLSFGSPVSISLSETFTQIIRANSVGASASQYDARGPAKWVVANSPTLRNADGTTRSYTQFTKTVTAPSMENCFAYLYSASRAVAPGIEYKEHEDLDNRFLRIFTSGTRRAESVFRDSDLLPVEPNDSRSESATVEFAISREHVNGHATFRSLVVLAETLLFTRLRDSPMVDLEYKLSLDRLSSRIRWPISDIGRHEHVLATFYERRTLVVQNGGGVNERQLLEAAGWTSRDGRTFELRSEGEIVLHDPLEFIHLIVAAYETSRLDDYARVPVRAVRATVKEGGVSHYHAVIPFSNIKGCKSLFVQAPGEVEQFALILHFDEDIAARRLLEGVRNLGKVLLMIDLRAELANGSFKERFDAGNLSKRAGSVAHWPISGLGEDRLGLYDWVMRE